MILMSGQREWPTPPVKHSLSDAGEGKPYQILPSSNVLHPFSPPSLRISQGRRAAGAPPATGQRRPGQTGASPPGRPGLYGLSALRRGSGTPPGAQDQPLARTKRSRPRVPGPNAGRSWRRHGSASPESTTARPRPWRSRRESVWNKTVSDSDWF